jgi:hypothetical protein
MTYDIYSFYQTVDSINQLLLGELCREYLLCKEFLLCKELLLCKEFI